LLPHSLALSHFAPLAQQRGYLVDIAKEDVSPHIVLPSSWENYLSQLKRKDRHELRRKLRRLDGVKCTRFHTVTERGLLHQNLTGFFDLFKLSSTEKAGFMTEQMRGFFEAIVHALAEEGYIRISFLEVDGQPVASSFCFDCWDHFHLYNSGFDPAHASLSVGLLCKAFCIREAILGGKKRFDFLRGAEPYKYHLGGQDVPIYRCVISRG
jgi:CelD/BcsL family acetyltransferase involved in cellulose biosynthesis